MVGERSHHVDRLLRGISGGTVGAPVSHHVQATRLGRRSIHAYGTTTSHCQPLKRTRWCDCIHISQGQGNVRHGAQEHAWRKRSKAPWMDGSDPGLAARCSCPNHNLWRPRTGLSKRRRMHHHRKRHIPGVFVQMSDQLDQWKDISRAPV